MFGKNNRIFGFLDQAWIKKNRQSWVAQINQGYGIGMEVVQKEWGVKFLLSLNPERDWSQALLHVGLVNRF